MPPAGKASDWAKRKIDRYCEENNIPDEMRRGMEGPFMGLFKAMDGLAPQGNTKRSKGK